MKKLSKEQQRIMDRAKKQIDKARACNDIRELDDWYDKRTDESKAFHEKRFNEDRNGIVVINCNYKSLEVLQEAGLVEIVDIDDRGSGVVIHTIKVLNY